MKNLFTIAAIAALATLAACSESAPVDNATAAPELNADGSVKADPTVDCGPKCQEHIENHQ